jgi:hypothetical protein
VSSPSRISCRDVFLPRSQKSRRQIKVLKFVQLSLQSLLRSQLCLLCRSTPFAPFSLFFLSFVVKFRFDSAT